jgi:hypothetical protein
LTPWVGEIPAVAFVEMGVVLLILLLLLICGKTAPKYMLPFQLYSFCIVVIWINLICSVIINFIELFVVVTDINSVFIGLTLLAFGASIGGIVNLS